MGHLLSIGQLLIDRSNDLPLLSSLRRLLVRELQVLLDSVEGVIDLSGETTPTGEPDTQTVHVKRGVNQRVRGNAKHRMQQLQAPRQSCAHCGLLRVILLRFCAQLDEIRDSYANLDLLLTEVAEEDQRDLLSVRFLPREILAEYTLQYLPQLGFLAKLPITDLTSPAAQLPGFEFKFRTDEHVFYKNGTVTDLDDSQLHDQTQKRRESSSSLCWH